MHDRQKKEIGPQGELTCAVLEFADAAARTTADKVANKYVKTPIVDIIKKIPKGKSINGKLHLLIKETVYSYHVKIISTVAFLGFDIFIKGQSVSEALCKTAISGGLDMGLTYASGGIYLSLYLASKFASVLYKANKALEVTLIKDIKRLVGENKAKKIKRSLHPHPSDGSCFSKAMELNTALLGAFGELSASIDEIKDKMCAWFMDTDNQMKKAHEEYKSKIKKPQRRPIDIIEGMFVPSQINNSIPEGFESMVLEKERNQQKLIQFCKQVQQRLATREYQIPIIKSYPTGFRKFISLLNIKISANFRQFSGGTIPPKAQHAMKRVKVNFVLNFLLNLIKEYKNIMTVQHQYPEMEELELKIQQCKELLINWCKVSPRYDVDVGTNFWNDIQKDCGPLPHDFKAYGENGVISENGPGVDYLMPLAYKKYEDLKHQLFRLVTEGKINFPNPARGFVIGRIYYDKKQYVAAKACLLKVLNRLIGAYKKSAYYMLANIYIFLEKPIQAHFYYSMVLEVQQPFYAREKCINSCKQAEQELIKANRLLDGIKIQKKSPREWFEMNFRPALRLILWAKLLYECTRANYSSTNFSNILRKVDEIEGVITRRTGYLRQYSIEEIIIKDFLEFKDLFKDVVLKESYISGIQNCAKKILAIIEKVNLPQLKKAPKSFNNIKNIIYSKWTSGVHRIREFKDVYPNQMLKVNDSVYWDGKNFRRIDYSRERIIADKKTQEIYIKQLAKGKSFVRNVGGVGDPIIYKKWIIVLFRTTPMNTYAKFNFKIYDSKTGKLLKAFTEEWGYHHFYENKLFFVNKSKTMHIVDLVQMKICDKFPVDIRINFQNHTESIMFDFIYADDNRLVYSYSAQIGMKYNIDIIYGLKGKKQLFRIPNAEAVGKYQINKPCFKIVVGNYLIPRCIIYKTVELDSSNRRGGFYARKKSENCRYHLFDIDTLRILPKPKDFNNLWRATTFRAYNYLLVGKEQYRFKIWNMRRLQCVNEFPCNVPFGFPNESINFKAGQIYMPKNPRATEFQIFELQQPLIQLHLQPKLPESNSLSSYAKSTLKWCSKNKLLTGIGLTVVFGLTARKIGFWIFKNKK